MKRGKEDDPLCVVPLRVTHPESPAELWLWGRSDPRASLRAESSEHEGLQGQGLRAAQLLQRGDAAEQELQAHSW